MAICGYLWIVGKWLVHLWIVDKWLGGDLWVTKECKGITQEGELQ